MSLKKAEFCEATPGTDSYLLGSSYLLPLYGEPVAARVGLLKRVETVSELGDCIEYDRCRGLLAIKEAHDIETRLNEVEKLLETVISMPCKYSRSEVVLTFFERSPLDQVLKNDNVHKIQPSFQSPVKISEIMRSNGFCLANTETIVIDHSVPNGKDQLLDADSTEHLFENGGEFTAELEDGDDPAAYVTNLSYYHLVPFETDILD
ncbi:PX domain-containing protein 1 [Microtus ochrogaster]|uniref:PX domain-containing protein 1 n=1 Tax=Microtus ochrogaster TaxID=79684 RepID=A0A8J6GUH1_MICOH|nr:PX domain-containing protein 1 [Microtus ochrogaster]